MKNSILAKKSIWVGIVLLIAAVVGIVNLMGHSSNSEAQISSPGIAENAPFNSKPQKNEAKSFRQSLSDMAWGRDRKEGPAIKPEARVAPAADSPEAQQAMMTLQSRMAYCAQNWEKDPSCGIRPKMKQTK